MNKKVLHLISSIERIVLIVLLFALLIVVIYSTVVFLILLYEGIIASLSSTISEEENVLLHLHTVFGFILVLIGIELLHTMKVYLKEKCSKCRSGSAFSTLLAFLGTL